MNAFDSHSDQTVSDQTVSDQTVSHLGAAHDDRSQGPASGARTVVPRRPSPLGGRRPTKDELPTWATPNVDCLDDVLPAGGTLNLLIVGINPGLWTAAVNAPFARPGNRFWPSLQRAGLTDYVVDASCGLSSADEDQFAIRGIGLTNLVGRATARADELSRLELQNGGKALVKRVQVMQPKVVAIAGITAFRVAFGVPKARMGEQDTSAIDGWSETSKLWVVPQPSGLNAHETIDSLAQYWRDVWASTQN